VLGSDAAIEIKSVKRTTEDRLLDSAVRFTDSFFCLCAVPSTQVLGYYRLSADAD